MDNKPGSSTALTKMGEPFGTLGRAKSPKGDLDYHKGALRR